MSGTPPTKDAPPPGGPFSVVPPNEELARREAIARGSPLAAAHPDPIKKANLDREILIHNEQTKLSAGAINTTALALLGGGFVLPLTALSFPLSSAPPPGQVTLTAMVVWALISFGLHWWSRDMLGKLK